MPMIDCISDKIDFENIMKDTYALYKARYYQKGSNKKYLKYQMEMVNTFLRKLAGTHIIMFKK